MSTAVHGGDVWAVAEAYGFAPEELLDFSANINPRGLPPSAALQLQLDARAHHWPNPLSGPARLGSSPRAK